MTDTALWRRLAEAGHTRTAEALDEARRCLAHDDPAVRELALGALDRAGVLGDDDLLTASHDTEPGVRRRVALLAASRPEFSVSALLCDPIGTVVEAAAWAAGEQVTVGDDVLDSLVTLATTHDDALVREASVAALGAIGDERGLPAILQGCTDKPTVRRRAVLALAPFDTPEVHAALEAARADHDWQVRQAADDLS
ncbi:MAG: HEAT repeat domain-containing protein [Ilumatobacteraceae bacterium]